MVLKSAFALSNVALLIALLWLVAEWTQLGTRRLGAFVSAATLLVLVVHLALPAGLLANGVTELRSVSLFGEEFVVHQASRSPWRPLLDVYLLAMTGLAAWAIARAVTRSPNAAVRLIGGSLAVLIACGLYDSLVDEGIASTPYLSPFGLLGLVVGGAVYLSSLGATVERRLREETVDLRWVANEQLRALAEARERLEGYVGEGRQRDERLTALTGELETLHALATTSPDRAAVWQSLERALATLGDVVSADRVTLVVDPVSPAVSVESRPDRAVWLRDGSQVGDPQRAADYSVVVESIRVAGARIGSLTVETPTAMHGGPDQLGLLGLVSGWMASFLHQLRLMDLIASTAVDAERHRLARELHDSVTQRLYSAAFLAEALPRLVARNPDTCAETAERIRVIVLSSLAELRSLLFELRPLELDAARIDDLLRRLAENTTGLTGAEIRVHADEVPTLPADVKLGLYRIAQEAVSNALRHSGADLITITLHRREDGLRLEVEDDGRGFATESGDGGYGLHSMSERAQLINGQLELRSGESAGTTVTVRRDGTGHRSSDRAEPSDRERRRALQDGSRAVRGRGASC
jgi:signal transduction histidine kinase